MEEFGDFQNKKIESGDISLYNNKNKNFSTKEIKWKEKTMIDLKFLRENPEIVKQNIKNKFQDHKLPLVDEFI